MPVPPVAPAGLTRPAVAASARAAMRRRPRRGAGAGEHAAPPLLLGLSGVPSRSSEPPGGPPVSPRVLLQALVWCIIVLSSRRCLTADRRRRVRLEVSRLTRARPACDLHCDGDGDNDL